MEIMLKTTYTTCIRKENNHKYIYIYTIPLLTQCCIYSSYCVTSMQILTQTNRVLKVCFLLRLFNLIFITFNWIKYVGFDSGERKLFDTFHFAPICLFFFLLLFTGSIIGSTSAENEMLLRRIQLAEWFVAPCIDLEWWKI